MTAFITRCLKKVRPDGSARFLRRLLLGACFGLFWSAGCGLALAAEITQLRVERAEDGLHLSASVNFELPPVVEDALMKGIPLFIVIEADIYRDRWYWTDPPASPASPARYAWPTSR